MIVSATVACPLSRAEAERLARAVLRAEGVRHAMLSVAFVGRRRIRTLNRRHFGMDRETDVVAFALVGVRGTVVGDVYVCPPVGAAQARRFSQTPRQEVRRIVVHGVLHVLGYEHPNTAGRTASPMWRRQERLLARLGGAGRRRGRP